MIRLKREGLKKTFLFVVENQTTSTLYLYLLAIKNECFGVVFCDDDQVQALRVCLQLTL